MKQSQNPEELSDLLAYLSQHNITSLLEIGSRYGTTLYSMAKTMPVGSLVVSVELAGGPWGRPDSLPKLVGVIDALCEEGYDARLITGNSRDESIVSAVRDLGPFDFCFIDGDHTYEGASADWNNYGPISRKIGFHDVNTTLDVAKLWNNIRADNKGMISEFICNTGPQMGIGVIEL